MLKRLDESFDNELVDLQMCRSQLEHELMTPLTAIRAAAEILRDFEGLTPDEKAQFMDVVVMESERLSSRVAQLVECRHE